MHEVPPLLPVGNRAGRGQLGAGRRKTGGDEEGLARLFSCEACPHALTAWLKAVHGLLATEASSSSASCLRWPGYPAAELGSTRAEVQGGSAHPRVAEDDWEVARKGWVTCIGGGDGSGSNGWAAPVVSRSAEERRSERRRRQKRWCTQLGRRKTGVA